MKMDSRQAVPASNLHQIDQHKVLNSWKEIASYIGRGVRTVQRYETQLGFPVRRPSGRQRSSVLAFPQEIDAWLMNAPARSLHDGDGSAEKCPHCDGTGKVAPQERAGAASEPRTAVRDKAAGE
jgi:hypothetical protein